MRRVFVLVALLALGSLFVAAAGASLYKGTGETDRKLKVTVRKDGRELEFTYRNVRQQCSNGQTVRGVRSGITHEDVLGEQNRFHDVVSRRRGLSVIGGRVTRQRATGFVRYLLDLDGLSCDSGKVRFSASRRGS